MVQPFYIKANYSDRGVLTQYGLQKRENVADESLKKQLDALPEKLAKEVRERNVKNSGFICGCFHCATVPKWSRFRSKVLDMICNFFTYVGIMIALILLLPVANGNYSALGYFLIPAGIIAAVQLPRFILHAVLEDDLIFCPRCGAKIEEKQKSANSTEMKRERDLSIDRTVTIRGRAELSVLPDYTTLSLRLKATEKNSKKAFENLQERTAELIGCAKSLGVKADDIKTINFSTAPSFRMVTGRKGIPERVVDGYECCHSLQIGFETNPDFLGRLVEGLGLRADGAEISIRFLVKDRKKFEAQLLEKLTADAMEKARIFCEPSGAKIGKLLCVNYQPGNIWVSPRPLSVTPQRPVMSPSPRTSAMGNTAQLDPSMAPPSMFSAQGESLTVLDMTPEEQRIFDEATFVWEIIDE